jgi:transcriptional repressor NrdR
MRRFTTFETIELTIQVHKRDGRYEDFQEQKLINGLEAACRHTRISHEQVRTLASQITSELMQQQVREISTKEIGEIVMKYLKGMDTIAYIRFACVYRRVKDMGELMEAIRSIEMK